MDGSESMNVPNDLADIGGDIGPEDCGLLGEGKLRAENRCGRRGDME